MARKNNAGFTKFADVIILETPTPPSCHPMSAYGNPLPLPFYTFSTFWYFFFITRLKNFEGQNLNIYWKERFQNN